MDSRQSPPVGAAAASLMVDTIQFVCSGNFVMSDAAPIMFDVGDDIIDSFSKSTPYRCS